MQVRALISPEQLDALLSLTVRYAAQALADPPEDVPPEMLTAYVVDHIGDDLSSDEEWEIVCSELYRALVQSLIDLIVSGDVTQRDLIAERASMKIEAWRLRARQALEASYEITWLN